MSKRNLGLMALLMAGGMTVAACGGGQSQPTTGGTTAEAPAAVATPVTESTGAEGAAVTLTAKTLDTFVYEPNTWTANAGGETTISLDNSAGTQEHSWVVLNKGVTKDEAATITDADTGKILFNQKVPAGQTASGTFTAPAEAGDYVVVCTIPGHAAGGMVGTLTVK
jgi:uncharacterized cupredoxin-like copper-binding protein